MMLKLLTKTSKRWSVCGIVLAGLWASWHGGAARAAQPARGLHIETITDAQGKPVVLYQESHALVLGVSDYTNGWPKLPGVQRDVEEIKRVLEAEGFQVITKMNLDRNGLDQAFTEFIGMYGQASDNRLLFYFAGHGHTVATNYGEELGYLVPIGAPLPKTKDDIPQFEIKALPLKRIEEYALQIRAKHALFVFDACFSGSLFALSRAMPEAIGYKTSQPVRQFITSGSASESVPDESIFRAQFVRAIQGEADGNQDGYVTGAELSEFLQTTVTNYSNNDQHPQYGKIRNPNLDKGDFVFKLPAKPTPAPVAFEKPPDNDFTLDDLKAKTDWQTNLTKLEAAFAQVTEYEKQNGAAEDKIAAWERFVAFAAKDNPYATRDDELRNLAQARLKDWRQGRIAEEPPATLRWNNITWDQGSWQ